MEKGVTIALVFLGVVVLAAILINITQVTGNATITKNANYGPVNDNGKTYHSCVYLTENDGWDVTRTRAVKYFDRLAGENKEAVDYCETGTKVREYNCVGGYMAYRPVICPPKTSCVDGSCIAN